MSQDDGKPDGTQDAFAAGLAIRRDMFGVEGAELGRASCRERVYACV